MGLFGLSVFSRARPALAILCPRARFICRPIGRLARCVRIIKPNAHAYGTPDMHDLPLHLWYSITRLGGAGLTLPLALTIALWLALGYTWRLAAGWLAVIAAAVGIVALTKIAFLGWGVGVREWDFTGVSGHAMLSTAVYPVALFLMLLPARPPLRALGVALG